MSKIDDLIERKNKLYKEWWDTIKEINKATNFTDAVTNAAWEYRYNNLYDMGANDLAQEMAENDSTYELIQKYFDHNDPRDDTGDDPIALLLGKAISDYHARAILLGDEG